MLYIRRFTEIFSPRHNHGYIFLLIVSILLSINFILTPLDGDQRVSIAYAQQASIKGDFPSNLTKAWNLRGIGYNLTTYLVYTSASSISDYDNKRFFEVIFKFHVLILYIVGTFASVFFCRKGLNKRGLDYISVGFLIYSSFVTLSYWASYQPEDIAAILGIVGIGIGVSKVRYSYVLSGILLSLTVTLKGSTGIIAPVGVLIIVAYDGGLYYDHIKLLFSGVLTGILIVSGLYYFFPMAIQDIVDATIFQSTGNTSLSRRLYSVYQFRSEFVHIPVLGISSILGVYVWIRSIYRRNIKRFTIISLVSALPILMIFIQGRGFAYHFSMLIPTGIFLILYTSETHAKKPILGGVLVIVFLLTALLSTTPFSLASEITYTKSPSPIVAVEKLKESQTEYQKVKAIIDTPDDILYLTDGRPTYYLGNKSVLRYHYPLPLQRSNARGTDIFRRTYKEALNSDPDFITH